MFTNTLHFYCTTAPTKPLSAKKRFSQTGGRREEFFPDDVVQYQVQDKMTIVDLLMVVILVVMVMLMVETREIGKSDAQTAPI